MFNLKNKKEKLVEKESIKKEFEEKISKEKINNEEFNPVSIKLSKEERLRCLKEIQDKLKKILYVYEKSQEPDSNYNYKVFCSGILIYVSSSNVLFNGELVNLVININSILINDFEKAEIKRIVFESINFTNHLINKCKFDKTTNIN